MVDLKKLKSTKFQAVTVDKFPRSYAYGLLRMLCYPLTKQKGTKTVRVQLVVRVDGGVHDVIEQHQLGVSDITQIDLELARCYFMTQNYGPGDWEACEKEFKNPRRVEVVLEAYVQEI